MKQGIKFKEVEEAKAKVATTNAPEPVAAPVTRPEPGRRDWGEVVIPDDASESDALTYVPGLVGDITDWIYSTARRPNRMMAFAAALAVMGTLEAYWGVVGPENNSTHLYIMNVADSGFGKDHPLSLAEDLMRAVGEAALLGPQTFASAPGFLMDLAKKPVQLLLMDEIGDQWKLIGGQGQNLFVSAIFGELKKAYNSFKIVRTAATTNRESIEIDCPAVTIVGASTPQKYWVGLSPAEFEDGFVNRILLLPTSGKRPPEKAGIPLEALAVPEGLKAKLQTMKPNILDQVVQGGDKKPPRWIKTDRVGWGEGALDSYVTYSGEIDALEDSGRPGEFGLAKRGAENAVRIATIIARARGSRVVEVEDIDCGIAIAKLSIETSLGGKEKFVKSFLNFDAMCETLEQAYKSRGWISNRDAARDYGRRQEWVGVFEKAHRQLILEERIVVELRGKSVGYRWNGEG